MSDQQFEQVAREAQGALRQGRLDEFLAPYAERYHPDIADELRYRAWSGNVAGEGPGPQATAEMRGALQSRDDALAAPPMRAPMPEAPPSGALRPPPRQLGTASDGSVMPVREPQPFRQSMVGGSDDLAEAARPRGALDAGNGGAVRLYRGITNGQLGGRYWTRDPEYASRQALGQGDRDGLAVMSADATFRNPYRVRDASESTMLEMPEIGRGQAWIDSLRAQGHDAIIDDLGNQIYVLDDSILTPAFGRARSPTPPRQQ
jgi:hypothetical protein